MEVIRALIKDIKNSYRAEMLAALSVEGSEAASRVLDRMKTANKVLKQVEDKLDELENRDLPHDVGNYPNRPLC